MGGNARRRGKMPKITVRLDVGFGEECRNIRGFILKVGEYEDPVSCLFHLTPEEGEDLLRQLQDRYAEWLFQARTSEKPTLPSP